MYMPEQQSTTKGGFMHQHQLHSKYLKKTFPRSVTWPSLNNKDIYLLKVRNPNTHLQWILIFPDHLFQTNIHHNRYKRIAMRYYQWLPQKWVIIVDHFKKQHTAISTVILQVFVTTGVHRKVRPSGHENLEFDFQKGLFPDFTGTCNVDMLSDNKKISERLGFTKDTARFGTKFNSNVFWNNLK